MLVIAMVIKPDRYQLNGHQENKVRKGQNLNAKTTCTYSNSCMIVNNTYKEFLYFDQTPINKDLKNKNSYTVAK